MFKIVVGENRVQEAKEKFDFVSKTNPELLKDVRTILIGTLQKNKIKRAIEIFDEVHSVDSIDCIIELDKQLERQGKTMPIFLQINVSQEKSKHGFTPMELEEAYPLLRELISIRIEGLMTMAPLVSDQQEVRSIFRSLRRLADRYGLKTSMGMSNDWKIAVEEGTDMMRIGSAVFTPQQ